METILKTDYRKMKPDNDPNNNIVVYYDEVNQWLFVSCDNQPKLKTVKRGFNQCLALAAQHHCSRLILDGYAVRYTADLLEVSDWLANKWLPAAQRHGLRYIAQLIPSEVDQEFFAKPSVPLTIRVESFHSLVGAVKWLYAQK